MQTLKNLPEDRAARLAGLIETAPDQVISMALSRSPDVQISLFSFADGETISAESYPGDTLYLLLEGSARISFGDHWAALEPGEALAVAAGRPHAIGGGKAFKMLQITFQNEDT